MPPEMGSTAEGFRVLTKTEAQDIRRVPAATLRAFLHDAMRACGLNEADAATVAGERSTTLMVARGFIAPRLSWRT